MQHLIHTSFPKRNHVHPRGVSQQCPRNIGRISSNDHPDSIRRPGELNRRMKTSTRQDLSSKSSHEIIPGMTISAHLEEAKTYSPTTTTKINDACLIFNFSSRSSMHQALQKYVLPSTVRQASIVTIPQLRKTELAPQSRILRLYRSFATDMNPQERAARMEKARQELGDFVKNMPKPAPRPPVPDAYKIRSPSPELTFLIFLAILLGLYLLYQSK